MDLSALIGGACAGLVVDLTLYPIDTIKTRLQSSAGFQASGGFRGIYSGISSVAVGAAPGAAAFFVSYEIMKQQLGAHSTVPMTVNHMFASSFAEVVACLVRVPCEVVKQRAQAGQGIVPTICRNTFKSQGISGFYRGYLSTISREIPFSVIQFPLWEYLKKQWSPHGNIEPWKSAVTGAISGGVAAFLTTPLDVAKTRIMLAENSTQAASMKVMDTMRTVYSQKGVAGLWSGGVPRVMWISIGGFLFLGVYDTVKLIISTGVIST